MTLVKKTGKVAGAVIAAALVTGSTVAADTSAEKAIQKGHYDRFKESYGSGQLSQAKVHIAQAIKAGYALKYWDAAALAEIFFFENKLELARKQMRYAVRSAEDFCAVEPTWDRFYNAVNNFSKGGPEKLGPLLQGKRLVRYLDQEEDIRETQYFFNPPAGIPRNTNIHMDVAINDEGRITCVALEPDQPAIPTMVNGMKKKRLKEQASSQWTYGIGYRLKIDFEYEDDGNGMVDPSKMQNSFGMDASPLTMKNSRLTKMKQRDKIIRSIHKWSKNDRVGTVTVEEQYPEDVKTEETKDDNTSPPKKENKDKKEKKDQ